VSGLYILDRHQPVMIVLFIKDRSAAIEPGKRFSTQMQDVDLSPRLSTYLITTDDRTSPRGQSAVHKTSPLRFLKLSAYLETSQPASDGIMVLLWSSYGPSMLRLHSGQAKID